MLHLITLGTDLCERGIGLKVLEQASTPRPPRAGPCSACSRSWLTTSVS
jgi:hypothetical protein